MTWGEELHVTIERRDATALRRMAEEARKQGTASPLADSALRHCGEGILCCASDRQSGSLIPFGVCLSQTICNDGIYGRIKCQSDVRA